MRRWAGLLPLAMAGAASAQTSIPTNTGNSAHDTLAGYSVRERNQALDRVLQRIDQGSCDVATSAFVEHHKGTASIWMATCRDGRRFVMKLIDRDDGAMAVFPCDETPEIRAYCDRQ